MQSAFPWVGRVSVRPTFVNPQILLSVDPIAVCGVLHVGKKLSFSPKNLHDSCVNDDLNVDMY